VSSAAHHVAGDSVEGVFSLQSGVRFRAYPGDDLAQVLAQWIGCQRVIYNAKVDEDRLFCAQRRLVLANNPLADAANLKTPLDRQYSHFKDVEQTPWLSDVPSQILRNGCDRWWEGKQRQLKGLSRMPRRRNRNNFNSVVITSELFRFVEWSKVDGHGKSVVQTSLELGTYNDPVGLLSFNAHCAFGLPKQLIIRRSGNHWWLSFSYEHAAPADFVPRDAAELAFELNLLGDDELKAATIGIDRNVKDNYIATSDGRFYTTSAIQKERLERKSLGAIRIQRRFARCAKGSKNSAKMRNRLRAKHEYRGNVGRDFSHQTSHDLVNAGANGTNSAPKLIVFENLKVKNMSAAPKAKQYPNTGKWLKNGAAQKAGLNKAILASCWGSIDIQVHYKADRLNTLVLKIPAAYSSQECSHCGHIHPDNRHEQVFVCKRCGFASHADTNASCVIAGRGIRLVRDQKVVAKRKKRVGFRKKNVQQKILIETKTGRESSGVPDEGRVRRRGGSGRTVATPSEAGISEWKSDAPTRARSV